MPVYSRDDIFKYQATVTEDAEFLAQMDKSLSENPTHSSGKTLHEIIATLRKNQPDTFAQQFTIAYDDQQQEVLTFTDAAAARDFVHKSWRSDSTSGIAPDSDQYRKDLNRGLDTYYFNGRKLRDLVQELRTKEPENFNQWFEVSANEKKEEVIEFRDTAATRAFTEKYLLAKSSAEDKVKLLDAICYHIHQAGLNNAINTPLFASQASAKLAAEAAEVDSYLILEQPKAEYHLNLTSNGKGVDIQSNFAYTGAKLFKKYHDQYTGTSYDPQGLAEPAKSILGQPKPFAQVMSHTSLSLHKDDPSKMEIAVHRVIVDIKDSRVIGLVDNNAIAKNFIQKIVDYCKYLCGRTKKVTHEADLPQDRKPKPQEALTTTPEKVSEKPQTCEALHSSKVDKMLEKHKPQPVSSSDTTDNPLQSTPSTPKH